MNEGRGVHADVVVILCLVMIVVGVIIGSNLSGHFSECVVVKKGHAVWVMDGDGSAKFEWLPPCVKSEEAKK